MDDGQDMLSSVWRNYYEPIDEAGTWLQEAWYQEYDWYYALKAFIERRGIRIIHRKMKTDAGILHTEGKLEITIHTPEVGLKGITTLIHEHVHFEMGHRDLSNIHLGSINIAERRRVYGTREIKCILVARLIGWMFYIVDIDEDYIYNFADCDDEIRAIALSIADSIADEGIFPRMRIKRWWMG